MIERIQQIARVLLGKPSQGEGASGFLLKASATLFVVQCTSLALGFLLNFLLVKTVAVAAYGTYVYTFNLLNLLVSFCLFGTDTLLVKMVSVYEGLSKFHLLKGLFIFAISIALVGSGIAAILSWCILQVTNNALHALHINWFLLAFPALVMLSFTALNQAYLQGNKKIAQSQLTEKIIKPLLLILIVATLLYSRKMVSVQALVWLNIIVIGTAMLFSFWFLHRSVAIKFRAVLPTFEVRSWLQAAASFFVIELLYVVNSRIDILMLGALKGTDAVGVYNIAVKLSELIAFGLAIVNFVMAPLAAALYKKGDIVQLQKLVTRSAQGVLIISLPIFVAFIFLHKQVLLLFGVSFLNGQEAFLILCAGQLLNVLVGSVGTLLLMSGYQKFSMLSLGVSLLTNILLNLLLTPKYGIVGTALATAGSLSIWNLLMYFFVRVKLKLRTTAFGIA